MKRLLFSAIVTLAACSGDPAPDTPVEASLENLVGYWGGQERNEGSLGFVFKPIVIQIRDEYEGQTWFAEAVGYESNFRRGYARLTDEQLELVDDAIDVPARLPIPEVRTDSLTFTRRGSTWTLQRQDDCAIPFTFVGEFAAKRPLYLTDGTLVYVTPQEETAQVRPTHCVEEVSNIPPGIAWAAGPGGELWIVDTELTAIRELRVRFHRVTDSSHAAAPDIETSVIYEGDELTGGESYGIADDGTGRPVVTNTGGFAWRLEGTEWRALDLPEPGENTLPRWEGGELVELPLPDDPELGAPLATFIAEGDVIWGAFLETLNGYTGRISIGRLDGMEWTTWPVGFGGIRGLRVRDDGVVDIAVHESLDYANLGAIEATPDGERFLTRYRRLGGREEPGTLTTERPAFGPDGAMFWGSRMRRPAGERGQRAGVLSATLTLGQGVSSVEIPVLGVTCDAECTFELPDNEGVEVRITADGPAELTQDSGPPARFEVLGPDRSIVMVGGGVFNTGLDVAFAVNRTTN